MRKRTVKSFWTKTMQRQVMALTRSAFRTVKKAQTVSRQVSKAAPTSTVPKGVHWHTGMAASSGGVRRYYLFKPAGTVASKKVPLIVMLHGCNQDAGSFAASTRMNQLATAKGFMVLYPEQDRVANLQACWNWYAIRSGRAQREAASILSAVDQVCGAHPVHLKHIVIAGLSAGASMAALLGQTHPERFMGVVMHSGVGPGMAESTATALAAMRGKVPKGMAPTIASKSALPALLLIQGNQDGVIAPSNGALTVHRWALALHARAIAPRVVQRGKRHIMTLNDWKVGKDVVATLALVGGLGHAWSGGAARHVFSDPAGPDASRMIWAFTQRQMARLT